MFKWLQFLEFYFASACLLGELEKNIPVASVNILDHFIKLTAFVPLFSFTLAIL